MVAYEFYRRDEMNGDYLLGILPERRKNPKRITEDSVMKWVRNVLSDNTETRRIFFVRVTLEDGDKENF